MNIFTINIPVPRRWLKKKDPFEIAEAELADWVAHSRFQSPRDGGLIEQKRREIYTKHGLSPNVTVIRIPS